MPPTLPFRVLLPKERPASPVRPLRDARPLPLRHVNVQSSSHPPEILAAHRRIVPPWGGNPIAIIVISTLYFQHDEFANLLTNYYFHRKPRRSPHPRRARPASVRLRPARRRAGCLSGR